MKRKITRLHWLALMGLAALPPAALAKMAPSPAYIEVSGVVNSQELTTAEKVTRLRELSRKEETRTAALHQLDAIDPAAAREEALALFRAADASRQTKLVTGRFILERNRPEREGFPKDFTPEFAKYLIQGILDGGEEEFFRKQDGIALTAVGEYAFLSSDFQGYKEVDFAPFKDARVVPILIRCLDAPDHVFAEDQGCLVRGEPGEPSGRNVARQQIPVALARLGDTRAIAPLETVLFKHADINERMNAAYALARLIEGKEDRAKLGRELLAQADLGWCRFPFGKGMIEAGDDGGVELLSLKHAGEPAGQIGNTGAIFYHLDRRLDLLQDFESAKVEGFIRELLEFQPWLDLVLFRPGSAKSDPATDLHPAQDEAEALERIAPSIIKTYGTMLACVKLNRITALTGKLQEIARESRSETIRRMTEECLKGIE